MPFHAGRMCKIRCYDNSHCAVLTYVIQESMKRFTVHSGIGSEPCLSLCYRKRACLPLSIHEMDHRIYNADQRSAMKWCPPTTDDANSFDRDALTCLFSNMHIFPTCLFSCMFQNLTYVKPAFAMTVGLGYCMQCSVVCT